MAYSPLVQKALGKAKAKPGDRVMAESDCKVFEGILLPRPELGGDAGNLIIKLDNGYNVGIKFTEGTRIKKLGEGARLEVFRKAVIEKTEGLPKLSLIATGGTISSRVDYKTGGVRMLLSPEEVLANVPELANAASLKNIRTPFYKMSEDMDCRDWAVLAKETAKELNSGADGVMITHGTDTLGYTAAALSFMLKGLNKPVAVVGAQRSPDRGSFDGAMNLVCAARYCASDIAEVAVVMHASTNDDFCHANAGTKVRKMHSSRRDAFRSINCQPIAKIWPSGRIERNWENYNKRSFLSEDKNLGKEETTGNLCYNKRSDGKVKADTGFEEKVALIKAYPGASPKIIDFFASEGYRGIVVEATALGHAPTNVKESWLPSLEKAVDEGIAVAFATQCLYGTVHPNVYTNLRKASATGVIYCGDMLPETAFIKLGWVLAKTKKPDKVREMMLTNYAHEFNERLGEKDFLV